MSDAREDWYERMIRERQEREARLVIGQRVVVDLGECRHVARWHGTIEQGETGRIMGIDIDAAGKPDDHRFWVWYDWPVRLRRSWSYAAYELTPIPDPTPDEIMRETQRRVGATRSAPAAPSAASDA